MANNTINSLQVFAGIIKEAFTSVYPDNKVFVREVKKNNGLVLTGLTICERNINIAPTIDIVNIGLHFFLKDVRPMLPPVMNRSIVDA